MTSFNFWFADVIESGSERQNGDKLIFVYRLPIFVAMSIAVVISLFKFHSLTKIKMLMFLLITMA